MKGLKVICTVSNVATIINGFVTISLALLDYFFQGYLYSYHLSKAVDNYQSTEYALAIKEKGVLFGAYFEMAFKIFLITLGISVVINTLYFLIKFIITRKDKGNTAMR